MQNNQRYTPRFVLRDDGFWVRVIGLLCLFGWFIVQVRAQNPVSINYDVNSGLPSNNVYFALQDHEGYLWFASDKGVTRYNGQRMITYTTADGLPDNECFEMFEDSKHRIWFATYNGQPGFYQNGKFYNPKNCRLLQNFKSGGIGLRYLEDQRGNIYYINTHGVFRIDANGIRCIHQKFLLYSTGFVTPEGKVYVLASPNNKQAVILALNGGKSFYDDRLVNHLQINTKCIYDHGNVFLFHKDKIIKINLSTGKYSSENLPDKTIFLQSIQHVGHEIWLGSNHGLITNYGRRIKQIYPKKSVTSVLKDRENNLWITSLNQGIDLVINPEILLYDHHSGLGFNQCHTIIPVTHGLTAIGSDNFKFAIRQLSKFKTFQTRAGIGNGIIKRVVSHGSEYLVSDGDGLNVFDPEWNLKSRSSTSTKDFYFMNPDTMISVGGNALVKIFKKNNIYQNWNERDQIKLKANAIYETPDHQVYVYGGSGIYQFDGQKCQKMNTSPLISSNIMDMVQTPDGILWIGSSIEGLIAIYRNQVFAFNVKNGLSGNYITSLAIGKNKTLWAGSIKGLNRIQYQIKNGKIEITCKKFNRTSGLVSETINDVAIIDDSLWIATSSGLCVCRPEALTQAKMKPNLQLTGVSINGKVIRIVNYLEIEPGASDLKLNFDALSYYSLKQIHFKYRLKGRQQKWNYSKSGQLEYPALSAGRYLLEVYAIDAEGLTSNPRLLSFYIKPYFYQTWWFLLLSSALLSAVVFRIIRKRIHRIKQQHELQNQVLTLENEKLKIQHHETKILKDYYELEQKALQLQMNPHFIFNSINNIQGLYKRNRELGDEYLIKFSSLLRNILEFSKNRIITLEQEINFIRLYLDINQLRFENAFHYKITVAEGIVPTNIGISPLIIQPFIENAMIHGLQTLDKSGELTINFYLKDQYLICEVSDNGIGREASGKYNQHKMHHSVGIEITEKRLRMFNNENEDQTVIEVQDLTDEKGAPAGTKVIIRMLYEDFYA